MMIAVWKATLGLSTLNITISMFPHFMSPSPYGDQQEWFFPAPQCLRPHLEDLRDSGWLDGWNLKPCGSIVSHPWLLRMAIDWSCWLQPPTSCGLGFPTIWRPQSGWPHLPLPTLGRHRATSTTFYCLPLSHMPVWIQGEEKESKDTDSSFSGSNVKDYCDYYFKPSKDSSNNFLKCLLEQFCFNDIFFYYSQYSRYYFY